MNENLINLILCLIENTVIFQIMNTMLILKNAYIQPFIVVGLSVFAMSINTLRNPMMLLVAYVIVFIYTYFNYHDSIKRKFFISLSVFCANAMLATGLLLITATLNSDLEYMMDNNLVYYSLVCIQKFILIVIFIPFRKMQLRLRWKLILSEMVVFFVCNLYVFYCFITNSINAHMTITILTFLAVVSIALVYVCYRYNKDIQALRMQNYFLDCSNASMKWYDNYKMVLHDMRNKTIALRKSLEEDDVAGARTILNTMAYDKAVPITTTNNKSLNYAIDNKNVIMNNKHIKLTVFVGNELKFMKDNDIIYLFDNLLEYGIEQSKQSINLQILDTDYGVRICMDFYRKSSIYNLRCKELLGNVKDIIHQYEGSILIEDDSVRISFFVTDKGE